MLTMRQKKAITRKLQNRYQKARKKGKIIILDEFTLLTSYNRSYAARVLRKKEILAYLNISGERVKLIEDKRTRRKKERYYNGEVLIALKRISEEADSICSKRLAPFLEEFITVLEKHGEIKLDEQVREKL